MIDSVAPETHMEICSVDAETRAEPRPPTTAKTFWTFMIVFLRTLFDSARDDQNTYREAQPDERHRSHSWQGRRCVADALTNTGLGCQHNSSFVARPAGSLGLGSSQVIFDAARRARDSHSLYGTTGSNVIERKKVRQVPR